MTPLQKTESVNLYEQVAHRVANLIEHGTFRPGDRIPSVRKLSRQQDVSITTILEAYRLLEDRGLIEARPQSGYYVRPVRIMGPDEPLKSSPRGGPSPVRVDQLVDSVLRRIGDPSLIQLGAAIPAPHLLPTDRLNRCLAAAARRLGPRGNNYVASPGWRSLRMQIARLSLASGCTLTPDDVLVTGGAQEALTLALRATCSPGDAVAIESPCYFGVLQAIEILGFRAIEIPTHPREGMDVEALARALQSHEIRACVAAANYANPLGSCMPDEAKLALVETCSEAGIPLIEDDTFGDLTHSLQRPKALKAFDREGNVLLCSSFSKTLAPGYRVGWIVGGRYQAELERLKFITNVATPTLPQAAIADFLGNGGYARHLRRIRRTYARQISLMTESIGRHFPESTRVTRPEGGFVLWAELPKDVDSLELQDRAIAEGISLVPGPLFSPKKAYRNFIRLNAAYWSDEVEEALAKLGVMVSG